MVIVNTLISINYVIFIGHFVYKLLLTFNMLFYLLCHHVIDFGHPAAKRFGLHVALHRLDGVVDDTAVFHLKKLQNGCYSRIVMGS